MVLTAYLDESYGESHQPLAMAGVIASAPSWAAYQDELQVLLANEGIKQFHAKKFRQRTCQFKGWSDSRCAAFNNQFLTLADKHLDSGFIVYVDPDDYRDVYAAPGLPRKVRKDTAYGLCVRAFIYRSIIQYEKRESEWPINLVLESGHRHQNDAARVFDDMKSPALAVPDSLAHFGFRVLAGSANTAVPGLVPTGPSTPVVHVSRPFMRRIEVDSELLAEFRLDALRSYIERVQFGRRSNLTG